MKIRTAMLLRSTSVAAIAMTGLTAGGIVHAAAAEEVKAKDDSLQEVVITAGRRQEDLQDVPVAVAALTAEALVESGVQDFSDLQALTPNLAVSEGIGGNNFVNIRGVGIGVSTPFQSAGVPLHIDGMFIPRSESFLKDAYFDLERVELYRGPQGTFAGQNSTGGAIFITAQQPKFNLFEATTQQTIGNYNWFKTEASANLPINDVLAARMAVNVENRDGFTPNRGAQSQGFGSTPAAKHGVGDPGSLDRMSLRGILAYKPTEDLQFRLRYDHVDENGEGQASFRTKQDAFNDPKLIDTSYVERDFNSFSSLKVDRYMLNGEYQINDGMLLKSITGYQKYISDTGADGDATTPFVAPVTGCAGGTTVATGSLRNQLGAAVGSCLQSFASVYNPDKYKTQELDLVSTTKSPLQWVVGGVVVEQKSQILNHGGNYITDPNVLFAPSATTLAQANTNLVAPGPNSSTGSELNYFQEHSSWGAFGQATYDISPKWQAIAGARYTRDKIELVPGSTVRFTTGVNPATLSPAQTAAVGSGYTTVAQYFQGEYGDAALQSCGTIIVSGVSVPSPCNVYGIGKFSQATGRLALNYFASEDVTFYGSVSTGFKPGGYTTQFTVGASGPQPSYKEETLLDYEAGMKATMFDGHLRVNVNGFYEIYDDYQASFRISASPVPRSINMDKATIKGFEFQTSALLGNFTIDGSVGYTDSEITKNALAPIIPASEYGPNMPTATGTGTPAGIPTAACPAGVASTSVCLNVVGLPLNFSPKWTGNIQVAYHFAFANGATLTPRLIYSYVDDQWVQLFHGSQDFLPSHTKLDFRLAYDAAESWRIEAFATNLTNEEYPTGVSAGPATAPFEGRLTVGAPRQIGVRVGYTFRN
ncbi:MAG: TonB-dependent receptor [Pseudomonadota bacterium]